jgi:uncharacterized protein YjdB
MRNFRCQTAFNTIGSLRSGAAGLPKYPATSTLKVSGILSILPPPEAWRRGGYMRQAVLLPILIFAFLWSAGCGGHSSSSSTAPASIQVAPAILSLNQGDVQGLNATVLDANGAAATNPKTITFSSSNPAVATVSPTTGAVCGGVWDGQYVGCAPGQVGTATITALSSGVTGTMTVYVHKKVDRVVITTPTGVCKSVGQTLQLAAAAFSNGVDVTSTVGPFNWGSNQTSIATVDANGVLTAVAPGAGSIFASVSNVASVPTTYTTCAVKSIHVHVSGGSASLFTLASTGATQALAADVVDTAGTTITPTLTWVSANTGVATVDSNGTVTSITPGTTSVLAECSGACNVGLPPVYSDVAVAKVSGTNATTVYATGTGSTQLVPIDSGTHAAGTQIALPSQPNSFLFAPQPSKAYLGSSGGLITLDAVGNTVTQNTAFPGKAIAVSPDGNRVLIADANAVYSVFSGASVTTDTLPISGATAAAFVPDNNRAFIIAGTNMYVYTPGSTNLALVSLSAAAKDVKVIPSAAFVFVANGVTNSIVAKANCDFSGAGTFNAPGTPFFLGSTPDASKILAADSPGIDVITRSSLAQPGCPPPLAATLTSADFGQGAFTPRQMIVTSDGSAAYIVSNLPSVLAYNVNTGATSTIPLANGASGLSISATLDGTQIYVGGSDNNIHRIDPVAGADVQQIPVAFTPDLVAVRPK